jgi:hypothetical protein
MKLLLVLLSVVIGLVCSWTVEASRLQLPRVRAHKPSARLVRAFENEGPPVVDRYSHFLASRQFPGYATENATEVLLEQVTGPDSGYDACG